MKKTIAQIKADHPNKYILITDIEENIYGDDNQKARVTSVADNYEDLKGDLTSMSNAVIYPDGKIDMCRP